MPKCHDNYQTVFFSILGTTSQHSPSEFQRSKSVVVVDHLFAEICKLVEKAAAVMEESEVLEECKEELVLFSHVIHCTVIVWVMG